MGIARLQCFGDDAPSLEGDRVHILVVTGNRTEGDGSLILGFVSHVQRSQFQQQDVAFLEGPFHRMNPGHAGVRIQHGC